MTTACTFSASALDIDCARVADHLQNSIRDQVFQQLRRRGAVVGLSGGIDSSVAAALCVRALGKDRVFGLFMPESDSSGDSLRLGRLLADSLGIRTQVEDISGILKAAGCYTRRDEAIRGVIPEFNERYKCKIALPNLLDSSAYAVYSIVAQSPEGVITRARMTAEAYLGVVAATNFKQRTRKMMEYYYADRFQYAVAGTPNLLEYDQGFFVKNGDGAADFKPLARLYKSQVYRLAEYLGVPEEIRRRPPTTDTYSLEQSQEEFYFALPYDKMDLCLYARDHEIPPAEAAPAAGLTAEQVERVYKMIDSKRSVTRYLHMGPLVAEEIPEGK